MSLNIFYTPEFEDTFQSVYEFIESRFGPRSANEFAQKTERTIGLISKNPLMYKASSIGETIRVATISKQSSLFYSIGKSDIYLHFLWDNRQEPIWQS